MFAERIGVVVLGVLGVTTTAQAVSYDVTATTLLRARQERRAGELHPTAPLYELITLTSSYTDTAWLKDARLVLSVWGDADVGEPRDGRHFDGDIDLAYGEGALLDGAVRLRLGRQLVLGGAARNLQLDGLSVTAEHGSGVGTMVFGGAPATRRFEIDRGDAAAGARVFFRPSFATEIGASTIHVLDHGRLARQDVGLDGRTLLARTLALSAFGLMSVSEGRLADADLQAAYFPTEALDVVVTARRTAPDLFLPRNSLFTVFSEETRDELGGRVRYGVSPALDVSAGYFFLAAPAGDGFRAEAEARWACGARRTQLGLEGSRLLVPGKEAERDGYWQGRAFARHRMSAALLLAGDVDLYLFDVEDEPSLLGAGSAAYHLSDTWQAVLTGRAGTTPLYARYFEGFIKIAYQATYREAVSPAAAAPEAPADPGSTP